jgi:hypothetical protein
MSAAALKNHRVAADIVTAARIVFAASWAI